METINYNLSKKLIISIAFLFMLTSSYGQNVPQGMKYQAVARDLTGEILADQSISLKISLQNSLQSQQIHYVEVHTISTNQLGLFSLVIGQGEVEYGIFSEIPWSTEDIWMEVAIRDSESNFSTISNSKLLAVPYAFHAATANEILSVDNQSYSVSDIDPGDPSEIPLVYWSTEGNSSILPLTNKLGTKDMADLVFITNDMERLRLTKKGNIDVASTMNIAKDLNVDGNAAFDKNVELNKIAGSTRIYGNLRVDSSKNTILTGELSVEESTFLNSNLTVGDNTVLNNSLTVNNAAPTELTGALSVRQETTLSNGLSVINGSPTLLSGDLQVGGKTSLYNDLIVNGGGFTSLTGRLKVDSAVQFQSSLDVFGETTFRGDLVMSEGNVRIQNGTLEVDSSTFLRGMLQVKGETTLLSDFIVNEGSNSFLSGRLMVDSSTYLRNSLTVDGETELNTNLRVNNGAATELSGSLAVDSSTYLRNSLTVDGETELNTNLRVNNGAATELSGSLAVDSSTYLKKTLTVDGETELNANLRVNNGATKLTGTLDVDGVTTLKNNFSITKDDDSFIATFENTNGDKGCGIKIKLGRTHGAWDGTDYLKVGTPLESLQKPLEKIREWVNEEDTPSIEDIFELIPAGALIGTALTISDEIFKEINNQLGLPFSIGPWGLDPPGPLGPWNIIGKTKIFPKFPENLAGDFLDGATLFPSFTGISKNNVTGSLTNVNEYITFSDKDDRITGSIRAASVENWRSGTIKNDIYMLNIVSAYVGVDLAGGLTSGFVQVTNFLDSYNNIGIEYTSGNGDYAEWLERLDPEEIITFGDIVGVKSGKITKDLTNAEQVMAVSYKPIVLGNIPEEGKAYLGNNIAFMGQIPVKVMGPVRSGDYIVGKSDIIGYGVAISPQEMTAEDFVVTVGRSWEANPTKGPKMVNTVVGVHNGDWVRVFRNMGKGQKLLDNRVAEVENKLQQIEQALNQNESTKNKYYADNE